MPLTAAQSQKLRDTMLAGKFDRDELMRVVQLVDGRGLDKIVFDGAVETVVFHVVNWCDGQGLIDDLLKVVAAARPRNRDVLKILKDLQDELNPPPRSPPASPPSSAKTRTGWRYQVVAFDLDATLIQGPKFHYSWRLVWDSLKLPADLHKQYRLAYYEKRITYQTWCERVCEEFQRKKLTRQMFADIVKPIHLTNNCVETLKALKREGFTLALVSGSIDTFLDELFPNYKDYFDPVNTYINRLHFDPVSGQLTGVTHTDYDFDGKTRAVEEVCAKQGCSMAEAVFVGEGENDAHVIRNVGLSIAYPPTVPEAEIYSKVIIDEDDLSLILRHIRTA